METHHDSTINQGYFHKWLSTMVINYYPLSNWNLPTTTFVAFLPLSYYFWDWLSRVLPSNTPQIRVQRMILIQAAARGLGGSDNQSKALSRKSTQVRLVMSRLVSNNPISGLLFEFSVALAPHNWTYWPYCRRKLKCHRDLSKIRKRNSYPVHTYGYNADKYTIDCVCVEY